MVRLTVRLLSRALALLSTPKLLALGRALGSFWFHLIPVRRGVAIRAAARAFPEKSPREVRALVKANFQHLMTSLLESAASISWPLPRLKTLVRYEGVEECLRAPRAAGKGVIGVSAHLGNFEMGFDAFGALNEVPLVLIARVPKGGLGRELLEAARSRGGTIEVMEPKGSGPKAVEALTGRKAVLAFVIDQNLRRGRGIFVPFLGELANTTTGFASLQRRAGAFLMAVQFWRDPDGVQQARLFPIAPDDHPHPRVAIINDVLALSRKIESFVRERPEQWFWVHRRWKARPAPGDLVRQEDGLFRFGKGRVAAFLPPDAPDAPTATRLLERAGIAVHSPASSPEGVDREGSLHLSLGATDLVPRVNQFLDALFAATS